MFASRAFESRNVSAAITPANVYNITADVYVVKRFPEIVSIFALLSRFRSVSTQRFRRLTRANIKRVRFVLSHPPTE